MKNFTIKDINKIKNSLKKDGYHPLGNIKEYCDWHWVNFGGIRLYIEGLTDNQMINLRLEQLDLNKNIFGLVIPIIK